jgi:RNA polymerase sigma-70 factor, ECF subfamily
VHPLFGEFDEWYEMAHPRVLASVLLVIGDLDRAADSTDEAFTRALARWGSVGRMQSPIGWTVRVAINVANRRLRRSSIEARLLRREVPTADVPAAAGEAWMAVRDLPQRQRQVLVMRYVTDLPEAEIAKSLGISRSTVSDALTDARRRLAMLLADPEVRHV